MTSLFAGLIPLIILGGLVFGIVAGLRSATANDAEPMEPAEVAKSFALHLGLFVALIACAMGLIDLLQAAVDGSNRLAGGTSDVARGLSLLIIAGPSFGLLLRAISARSVERVASGSSRPMRGWSVYLVAALSTTLIASLVSVAQIADDLVDATRDVERDEVAQLVVWLGLWLVHWFVLRPWLRVRGDAHLAIGTIVGLTWMLSGAGAVVYRLLDVGYDSVVDRPLDSTFDTELWLIVSGCGAIVWAWHWFATFDAPAPGNAIEGFRRASPLWFFTVVVAGILPGLIAMVVTVSTIVSGLLIWFVGTTDADAAEYFRPGPGLVAALFIGFVTWAYHRWVLDVHGVGIDGEDADEVPVARVRNESIRFHDYVAVTAGLIAVVGATAALVALVIDTLAAQTFFASTSRTDNTLIIILTVLGAGALLWWQSWNVIESARAERPEEESDSFWRKLYLIAGFGLGGLVLGISLIWVLYAFLRDVLDGALGRGTLEDVADPVGWAIAVVGAVWYHFGVWQSDRTVLEARQPPPPVLPPPPARPNPPASSSVVPGDVAATAAIVGLSMRPATAADAGELFTIQMADRAARFDAATGSADPLETFAEMRARLEVSDTTVITDGRRIIGFVSRPLGTGETGKIQAVVAPDRNTAEIVELLASGSSPGGPTS